MPIKVFMIALMNTALNKRIDLSNFCIDGNKKNLDGDNLDIQRTLSANY